MKLKRAGGRLLARIKNNGVISRSLLLVVLALSAAVLSAQVLISGRVLSQHGEPLPYASIVALSAADETMLGYGQSDTTGTFSLRLDPGTQFRLVARSLGYRADTQRFVLPLVAPITFRLNSLNNELPEVTVAARGRPMISRGDTITFAVDQFRDTTDAKIEDVLRKLPGIEVNADGSIQVGGKPLHRLLVEGSDLFGADYQLGTKNIDARVIETVEQIDRYQANAILKGVNTSDRIVLNLKLRPEVKSVLTGEVETGGGPGANGKYEFYAPVFRIEKRHKSMLIVNADNLARDFGITTASAAYADDSEDDLERALLAPLSFYESPRVDHLALDPIFTDRGKTTFSTLRHDSRWSDRLTTTFSVSGLTDFNFQRLDFRQELIDTLDAYSFSSTSQWEMQEQDGQFTGRLTYLSKDHTSGIRLYATTERRSTGFDRSTTGALMLGERFESRHRQSLFRLEWSQKLSQGAVLQLRSAYETTEGRERTVFLMDSFPATPYPIDQVLRTDRMEWLTEGLFHFRTDRWVHTLSIAHRKDAHEVTATCCAETTEVIAAQTYGLGVRSSYTYANARLAMEGKVWNPLTASIEALQRPVHFLRIHLDKETGQGSTWRLSATTRRDFPALNRQFHRVAYFQTPTLLRQAGEAPQRFYSRRVQASFRHLNDMRLSNFSAVLSYDYVDNLPVYQFDFAGTLVEESLRYGGRRSSLGLKVKYSRFLAPLKSDVSLSVQHALVRRLYQIRKVDTEIEFNQTRIAVAAGYLIGKRLRVKGTTQLIHRRYREGTFTENTHLRADCELLYDSGMGRWVAGTNYAIAFSALTNTAYRGTFVGWRKEIQLSEKNLTLTARLYNPLGSNQFTGLANSDLYLFSKVVPSSGRFAYVLVSFGL